MSGDNPTMMMISAATMKGRAQALDDVLHPKTKEE